MENIIEIIPDNLESWTKEAIENGQLWNAINDRIYSLEFALKDVLESFDAIPCDCGGSSMCPICAAIFILQNPGKEKELYDFGDKDEENP